MKHEETRKIEAEVVSWSEVKLLVFLQPFNFYQKCVKLKILFFVQLDNPKFTLIIVRKQTGCSKTKTGCQVTNMIP